MGEVDNFPQFCRVKVKDKTTNYKDSIWNQGAMKNRQSTEKQQELQFDLYDSYLTQWFCLL